MSNVGCSEQMKEIVSSPPPLVQNQFASVKELFNKHVVPSYARFELAFARGEGSHVWDVNGRRYLDLGTGIAVCSLGHAHPEVAEALAEQARRLVHVSNLYYQEPQGRLAQALTGLAGPGKIFFCNSGAEANECLYKLARKFGHAEGRFEILTTANSFHGRTLAGIAATGQDKVKKGFEPAVPGFRQVPFNDLEAMEAAISPATAAVLIEGIQGEGGILPATPEYLLGLRRLCDERRLLLMMDAVQCGFFRTGRFLSHQRILEDAPSAAGGTFVPDAVSLAKSLGGGLPIGAAWIREPYQDLLGAGTHGTTFGGTPLACAAGLKILEIVQRDGLADNARRIGAFLKGELQRLATGHPRVIRNVRGLGFMIGFELSDGIPAFGSSTAAPSLQMVQRLHEAGVLTIPSGQTVVRLLPALNLRDAEAAEGIRILENVVKQVSR
jgi:acetylornithine/N-succinyldiaminopimelate aminotransferase